MYRRYLSKSDLESDQRLNIYQKRSIGYRLYKNIEVYRKIVTSEFYLRYHYYKRDRYFNKTIKTLGPFEVVHCHDLLSAYYFIGNTNTKKVLTIHSKGTQVSELEEILHQSIFLKLKMKEFSRREYEAFTSFDIITFPSNAACNLFLNNLQISDNSSDKVKIIFNGIDVNRINSIHSEGILEKYQINKDAFDLTLLNVAQHVKPKNIDLIIKSIEILNKKYNIKALLINIGEGYLTDYYREIIKQNSLENQIRFLGMIPNDDVIRLMKTIDIFIQASEKVVFDLVVLEALQSEIKIIVSDDGGNKEIIKNNSNGILIEELNEECIANKVFSSINFVPNFEPDSFEKKYSISKMVEKYYNLY